ncbi:LysE family translocator [Hwanghaeella grinnelliae]|uniref:LysE family translocator n=1 Tax=Hwanghaeella grinnelliae TaxID=2500179 RepID=A0A437QQS5_9PROT|nr:LysE family translocator [Hwanghaeella grinnelliae]RVU36870.1 LysE family translocator [Hwanghaeella grinnelliae]
MLTFTAAFFLTILTPGPGVLTTAGVGSGFGYRPGLVFLLGLWVGTNAVALAVVTGLAAAVLADETIRTVLIFASAGYLLYLALRIARSGSKISFIEKQAAPGFLGGVMLQLINPKAYVVNSAFFFGYPFHLESLTTEILLKFLLTNIIWIPVHLIWLAAGVTLHRLDLTPRAMTIINSTMAVAMLVVVALTTWSGLDAMSNQ